MLILDQGTRPRAEQTTGPAIEVEALVKDYAGGKRALAGVSFSVERGEIFGFLGPNGSGKSTTVRVLVTLLRQTSGLARVLGADVTREANRVRNAIGYAGQSVGVDDDLTARENLELNGVLHGVARVECSSRAGQLLEAFSLSDVESVRAARLSGGLRRRLDLAQALVHRPAVLFLDEPTTGLDPQSRNALWALLGDVAAEGTTVFLTTQYLEEADRTCDRVAIIDEGRIVTSGTPKALKDEVGGGRLALVFADPFAARKASQLLAARIDVTRIASPEDRDGELTVYVDDPNAAVAPLMRALDEAGLTVARVAQAEATLDDVFLRYTGERVRAEPRIEGGVSSMFKSVHGRRRH
jgi:daunorubicin resistance ABC transporter ATP-binding subunit